MADKDISEKQLEEYSDVFADIVNVLLFDGEQKVDPDDLSDAPSFSTYHDDKNSTVRKLERDVAKYWNSANVRLSYIGLENQTNIYKYMPLRIIGYDGTFYRNELNESDDAKSDIIPVVTMILYFGDRRWKKPISLKDCLNIPPGLLPYFSDYKLNIFEIAWLSDDTVSKFKSDFKFVAEYFTQMRKTGYWKPMPEVVKHVYALLDLFKSLTKDNNFLNLFNENIPEGESFMFPSALKLIEESGFERGITQGISQGITQGISQGISQGKIEIAKAMLVEGEPLNKIQKFTKLSLEYIKQLAEKQ